MLRMLMFLSVAVAQISAFGLYTVSYETREIAEANQRAEKEIGTLSRDIAILRAERTYLMRPERIEPLARKLGMQPVRGEQFISGDELRARLRRP